MDRQSSQKLWEFPYTALPELGENDRSATGYLSEPEFDDVVDEFFRRPEESVWGWERAIAQSPVSRGLAPCPRFALPW
jgi:hypothetical protein